jgi:putative sugar O-methyltransferase
MNKWPNLLPEDYNTYSEICKRGVEEEEIFNTFKSQPRYVDILEHTLPHQANDYISLIEKSYKDFDIPYEELFKNDEIGSPQKSVFMIKDMVRVISPSNLRYLYFGLDILNFLQENDVLEANIVEIGGGYGGQCYYLNKLAPVFGIKINKYIIFDLPDSAKLAQKFLDKIGIKNTKCIEINETETDLKDFNFVFSNYAYSEFDKSVRDVYLDKVISKMNSGYFAWNTDEPMDQYILESKIINIEPEKPETRPGNKVVKFINK